MNTRDKIVEPVLEWDDLDQKWCELPDEEEASAPLFDEMVERQNEQYGALSEPCREADQLLEIWSEDAKEDVLPDWHAAVSRFEAGCNVIDISEPLAREQAGTTREESGVDEAHDEQPVDGEPEVILINDAEVIGTETPEMGKVLDRNVVFMTGELWDQGDRRNTKAGEWKRNEMRWSDLLLHPESPLTNHAESGNKQGPAIVLGETIDGNRNAESVKALEAVVIDVDSGPTFDHVVTKLKKLGLFSLVYTSFNHNKTKVVLKHDDVVRKLKLDETPNRTQVIEYLRNHHKDRYDEEFLDGIEIANARHHGPKGLQIILETPPLHKFRIVLPLREPVELASLGTTATQWKDKWADLVTGFVVNELNISFDSTSCDVNRLFYLPRHPKGSDDWDCVVIMGKPLDINDIKPHSKIAYLKDRGDANPFTYDSDDDDKPPLCITPNGKSLNKYHTKFKHRLLLPDLLLAECPEKVRREVSEGKVEIECPFEHEHSTEGGTGTVCMDPQVNEYEVWTISCPHDACQGRHKLQFLEEMLRADWFPESALFNPEYLLGAEDDDVTELDGAAVQDAVKDALTADSNDADIRAFLLQFIDADTSTTNRIVKEVADKTELSKPEAKSLMKDLRAEAASERMNEEVRKRQAQPQPDYTPLAEATEEGTLKAAAAANWLPAGFTYRDGWFCSFNYETQKVERICAAFVVVYSADGKKGKTRQNQLTIRYPHRSKKLGIVESTFRIGDTYKDSGTILGTLRNEGLEFAPGAKTESILTLLRAISSDREAVYCAQSGWTEERDAYVSPTGAVVKRSDDERMYVLDQTMRVSDAEKGTTEDYRKAANTVLRGKNAKLQIPGMLLGAVGCLADFLGVEHAVTVANEGKKNSGKTTSLKIGVTFIAVASAQGLTFSANSTETAFEAMAMKANGAAMVADDSGASKGTAEDEQRQIYQYANRTGRGRGTTKGGLQEINEWNGAMGMSTERGLLARLAAEDGDVKSGVQSRVFTVDFETAEVLDKTADADLLAAYDVLAHGAEPTVARGVYGVAWKPFAEHLLEQGVEVIGARVSQYEKWWGQEAQGGERVVKIAALMAVAADGCQACGLWPANDHEIDWSTGSGVGVGFNVQGLIKQALSDTLAQRAGVLDTEKQTTENLRLAIIRAVGRNQIVATTDSESGYGDILGYWKSSNTKNGNSNVVSTSSATEDEDDVDSALAERTYILPVDRVGKLGIKTDVGGLVSKLREAGAIVLPKSRKSKYFDQGLWETLPNEGRVKNVRVSGAWVHGVE